MYSPIQFVRAATLFAAFVFCGNVSTAADPMKVKPGGFAEVTVKVPDGAGIIWRFSSPPVQKADDLTEGRLIFGGEPGTTVTATALIVNFDPVKKKTTLTEQEFVFVFPGVPKTPPIDPPPTTGAYYFLIIQPDGPAPASLEKILLLPAWADVRKAGAVKLVTQAAATKLGYKTDKPLPAVVTIRLTAAGPQEVNVVSIPTTNEGVAALVPK